MILQPISKTQVMIRCALFSALIAIGAFIRIPVPYMDYFTLQFLFVLLAGILLGPQKGASTVGVYVLLGLFGLPIFAAGGGLAYIFRPSFGYLLGFILGAWVVGTLGHSFAKKSTATWLISALVAMVAVYAVGIAYKYVILNFYLGQPLGLWLIFLSCFPIDLPGDVLLSLLAATLAGKINLRKVNL